MNVCFNTVVCILSLSSKTLCITFLIFQLTCGDNISALSEFSSKTQLPPLYPDPPCKEGEKEQHAEMMLSETEVNSVSLPSITSLSDVRLFVLYMHALFFSIHNVQTHNIYDISIIIHSIVYL